MRRGNIDITFIIIIVLLAGSSLRSGMADPKQWLMEKLLLLPGIIIGLSLHEFGHAVVAYKLGDNTPKLQGRVTINPMAHIDWMGLAALFFCGFGWGQPVQINPYNFKHRRRDELFVSLAGVVMNLRADDSFVEDAGWHRAAAAYADFLRRHETGRVLYLELGVGANTPVIIKYPFWQMTAENPAATYACVNYSEAFCPKPIEGRSICVNRDIGAVLGEIE